MKQIGPLFQHEIRGDLDALQQLFQASQSVAYFRQLEEKAKLDRKSAEAHMEALISTLDVYTSERVKSEAARGLLEDGFKNLPAWMLKKPDEMDQGDEGDRQPPPAGGE